MKNVPPRRNRKGAQVLVFLATALIAIILLAGLAIDSGLLYLSKARLSRAVDGAALAAVGNFHQYDDPTANQAAVANTMRNFAVVNFSGLTGISTTATITTTPYTLPNGQTGNTYTYNFNDGTKDTGPSGNYKKYVEAVLYTGSGGDITSAICNARCPVQTYFMGVTGVFKDLKVSSNAVATRKPRLIMVVVDRSASMLADGASVFGGDDPIAYPPGGAYGLPQAIATFLNFFDTTSDSIGIVSFSSNARLEMPLTTNFLNAGTNVLFDAYQYDTNEGAGIPGTDPEQTANEATYAASGVRRLKFGGTTAADEGIRLGLEEMMANSGFNNPDVVKYLVLFTDGDWNNCRTLLAAPGYTNVVKITSPPGALVVYDGTTNLLVPALKPLNDLIGGMMVQGTPHSYFTSAYHLNEWWQSADGYQEPIGSPTFIQGGTVAPPIENGIWTNRLGINYVATNLSVWLQPGSVDYAYTNHGTVRQIYVSDMNNPTNQVKISLGYQDSNVLVVPGYIADGNFFDGIDLPENDNHDQDGTTTSYPRFKANNYEELFMWPDLGTALYSYPDTGTDTTGSGTSNMRQLVYRNYANLLTGFYIFRADDPLGSTIEPLTGAQRPIYGLGPYYPSAGFYWPFDSVGMDWDPTYSLRDPTVDPDTTHSGLARHGSYSINMQSTNAAPEWTGELFYKGISANLSGTSAASTLMASASQWQAGMPSFMSAFSSVMTTDPVHNTNLAVANWRPATYNGSSSPVAGHSSCVPGNSATGGFVADGPDNGASTHYYANSMAYSGRPTHYFDFTTSTWRAITNNHIPDITALPMGNWKVQEYAWHARASGVTFFTVGYGGYVSESEQALLAVIANSTNTTAGGGSNMPYNALQPIGQQFYATNATQISNDFYQVGQAINASLTQ